MTQSNRSVMDINNLQINALLKQFEILSDRHAHAEDRNFLITGWVIAVLVGMIGSIFNQTDNYSLSIFFRIITCVTPIIATLLMSILLWQFYAIEGLIRRCRLISDQINNKINEIVLIEYSSSIATRFFSRRRGNLKYKILAWLLIMICIGLGVIVTISALLSIYTENHLVGSIYSIIIIFSSALLFYSFRGLVIDLPKYYDNIDIHVKNSKKIPKDFIEDPLKKTQNDIRSFFGFLLPRPNDLVEKGAVFLYGFIAALSIYGLHPSQINRINYFFQSSGNNNSSPTVPAWAIWALGGLYFFAQEFLLQQAKLLWNDIRDEKFDQKRNKNKPRAFLNAMSKTDAKWHVVIRWTLALFIGYFVGGWSLFGLFVVISLHQFLYELWGKPTAKKHSLRLLILISFNVLLRCVGGIMVVAGSSWISSQYLVLYVMFYFYSFGFMAILWKADADYYKETPSLQRLQSVYFSRNGKFRQNQGQLGAILVSLTLILMQLWGKTSFTTLNSIISWHNPNAIKYSGIDTLSSIFFVLILITLVYFTSFGLVKIFYSLKIDIPHFIVKTKGILMIVFYFIFIVCLFWAVLGNNPLVYFLGILSMNLGLSFMCEGMTYKDFLAKERSRQLPDLMRDWSTFFYNANPKKTFSYLIKTSIAVLNNKQVYPKSKPKTRVS